MSAAPPGPMYDFVARGVSEVEHEVIAWRGDVLDLLRVAREQDAEQARLRTLLEQAGRAIRHTIKSTHGHSPNACDGCVEAEYVLSQIAGFN